MRPYPGDDSPLLPEASKLLTNAGIHNPLAQIYITTETFQQLPMLLFLFTTTQLPKYAFDSKLACVTPCSKKSNTTTADMCALAVGILTLLRQFHSTFLTGARSSNPGARPLRMLAARRGGSEPRTRMLHACSRASHNELLNGPSSSSSRHGKHSTKALLLLVRERARHFDLEKAVCVISLLALALKN